MTALEVRVPVRPHVADAEVVGANLRSGECVEALAVDLELVVHLRAAAVVAHPHHQVLVGAGVVGHGGFAVEPITFGVEVRVPVRPHVADAEVVGADLGGARGQADRSQFYQYHGDGEASNEHADMRFTRRESALHGASPSCVEKSVVRRPMMETASQPSKCAPSRSSPVTHATGSSGTIPVSCVQ